MIVLIKLKVHVFSQASGLVTEVKYKIKYTGNRWNFSDINNIVLVQMFAYLSYCGCFSLHQNVYANHIVNCTIDVCFVFETLYICLPFLF